MVAGDLQGREPRGITVVDICSALNEGRTGGTLGVCDESVISGNCRWLVAVVCNTHSITAAHLVPQRSEHERCPAILVALVYTEHHDKVADDSRMLADGHCHVKGVWVIHSTGEEGREGGREGGREKMVVRC